MLTLSTLNSAKRRAVAQRRRIRPDGLDALKIFIAISVLSGFVSSVFAQGTAFTYQGRLNDGASPANGVYDLRFTIYDSTNFPGVVIAGPLTNSATGVAAFRNAQFQAAIMHFKESVRLDSTLLNAKLYLATAYAQLYIPGGESEDNVKLAKQAIAGFDDVLTMDPQNTTAIASAAQIYYQMKDFDKAKEYQRRRLVLEPNNPEPYYWIGVINWAICYPHQMQLRRFPKQSCTSREGPM